jgi:AcrR family transcriptional regulator
VVDVGKWLDSSVAKRLGVDRGGEQARRAKILLAAVDAVEELGAGVGVGEVAERAGIARPHVYRVFASKEALDAEVARFAATELVRRVRPHYAQVGRPYTIVHGVILACVEWAAEHPNLYRFLAAQQQTKAWHRARMGRTRFLQEIATAMDRYLDAGGFVAKAPDGVLAGLMGMVDASIIWWLDHKDESKAGVTGRLTRQVMLVLKGMLADLGMHVDDEMIFDPGEKVR